MFSLEQVNEQVDLFNKETKMKIPYFLEIIHHDNNKDLAHIKESDIINGDYKIYISNALYQYDVEYQNSVLWHEFVHVFDGIRFHKVFKNAKYITKTCSEAFAMMTQLEYLRKKSRDSDTILYEGKEQTLWSVVRRFINISDQQAKVYLKTKHPYAFDSMVNNFCYFCGGILWAKNPIELLNKIMADYTPEYQKELLEIGVAILKNQHKLAGDLYGKLYESQKAKAFEEFDSRLTELNDQIKKLKTKS